MMSPEEVKNFCVKNAGRVASGKRIHNKDFIIGRITSFAEDGIFLEVKQKNYINDKLPDPLPEIPYFDNLFYWVISPCCYGDSVFADDSLTLILDKDEIKDLMKKLEL